MAPIPIAKKVIARSIAVWKTKPKKQTVVSKKLPANVATNSAKSITMDKLWLS